MQVLLISVTVTPMILLLKLMGSRLSNRYAAGWKYYVWLVLAVRLLIPWSPTLPMQPLEIVIPREYAVLQKDVIWLQEKGPEEEAEEIKTATQWSQMQPMEKGEGTAAANNPDVFEMKNPAEVVSVLWLVGAIVYWGYHIAVNLYCRKKLQRWSRPAKAELLAQIQYALGEQMLPGSMQVWVSSQIKGPMLVGLFRPRLFLPERTFKGEELELILRHELTHYQRGDLWYKVLLLTVNGVHWFNPFVYMMCREAEKDLECSCDSIVIGGAEKEVRGYYANLILAEAVSRNRDNRMLSSNFHGRKGELKMRVKNIIEVRKKKKGAVALGIVVAMVIIGSGLWTFSLEKSNAKETSDRPPKEETAVHQATESGADVNAQESQQEILQDNTKHEVSAKSELLEMRDDLLLDGNGAEDKLLLYRMQNGEEGYNVLAVLLDSGLTAIHKLPSNYADISDDSHIYVLPLQSGFYQSIIVRLSDPKATGKEAGTDYYILHVEVDEENQTARIVEDVAILNKMTDSKNYAEHEEAFVELPCYHVIHHLDKDRAVHYHEELEKCTLMIKGYAENAAEEITSYVYWDGDDWQIYIE